MSFDDLPNIPLGDKSVIAGAPSKRGCQRQITFSTYFVRCAQSNLNQAEKRLHEAQKMTQAKIKRAIAELDLLESDARTELFCLQEEVEQAKAKLEFEQTSLDQAR